MEKKVLYPWNKLCRFMNANNQRIFKKNEYVGEQDPRYKKNTN